MCSRYTSIFIGVNYCSSDETCNWIRSILKLDGCNLIVILDNSAERADVTLADRISELSNDIIYINNGHNLGYMPGANYVYQEIKKWGFVFDFLVVSNVDLEFETKNYKQTLYAYDTDNVGIIAPAIVDNGKDLNPYRINKPTKRYQKFTLMYFKYPVFRSFLDCARKIKKRLHHTSKTYIEDGMKIYMPYGACFIFTKHYFEAGGNLQHELFLYAEESFVAEQCRKIHKDIIYVPDIYIKNKGHVSTGTLNTRVHSDYLVKGCQYVLKHYYD